MLFRHRPEAIGRPVIHTHHIYMNEHILFWMLRAQIIRICNVEMKIWGFTPSSGAFSKWLSRRKCRKTKNRNFCISTSNYHRYIQFISRYMFLRMTSMVILVKNSLYIKKDFKIHDGRQFWQKIVISMKSTNMPVSILPKTKSFKVLCVFIANYGANNEKSEIHGLPGVLKMLTMKKSKNPKLTISVRQFLFITDLYYSTLNNDKIHYQ